MSRLKAWPTKWKRWWLLEVKKGDLKSKISDFNWRRRQKSGPANPIETRTARRMLFVPQDKPALQENDVGMSGENRRV
jgi:hypothetical protein